MELATLIITGLTLLFTISWAIGGAITNKLRLSFDISKNWFYRGFNNSYRVSLSITNNSKFSILILKIELRIGEKTFYSTDNLLPLRNTEVFSNETRSFSLVFEGLQNIDEFSEKTLIVYTNRKNYDFILI